MNLRYYILSLTAAACVAVSGCTNEFEEHYSVSDPVAQDGTVYDCLQADGRFTKFLAAVDEAGLKDYLSGVDLVTVWAPTDETVPENMDEMTPEDRKFLIQNHISVSTIYSRNVTSSTVVATIAGKNLNASNTTAEGFVIGGQKVVNPDRLYQNGLVQEIDGWLVPLKSIAQWIESLSDDYSMFRDSLFSHNVRHFDKDNSPIIGVDTNGVVVYDSVWVVSNDYLNNIDLGNDASRYTLFVPDNDAINRSLETRRRYFDEIGREFTGQDSLDFLNWMMKASMYRGRLDIKADDIIKSVSGNELRMSYQTLKDTLEMSNGVVYTFDTLYVPRDIHYSKLEFNPYYLRREFIAGGGGIAVKGPYDEFSEIHNANSKIDDNLLVFLYQYKTAASNNYCQYEIRGWDEENEVTVDMPIMPGHYTLRMQFVKQGDDDTDIFNIYEVRTGDSGKDELVLINQISGVTKNYFYTASDNGKNGLVSDDWEFTGKYEKRRLRVEIPGSYTVGTKRRIRAGACVLIPNDNY